MKKIPLGIALAVSAMAATAQTRFYVAKYKGDRAAAVSYTFDDGLLEQYTELFPRLKEHGIKASFCVNGNTSHTPLRGKTAFGLPLSTTCRPT